VTVDVAQLQTLADRGRALVRQPQASSGDWYRIVNADGERAELFIYGVIGSDWDEGDVTAAAFVKELRGITASAIDLHLNSPGGLVWDGIAIYSALLNHPATVDVYVDGVAASAASFVAMAGDSVTIEKPARMFIHDARAIVLGNAEDMREAAQLLDDTSDTIAGIYADHAGGTIADWRTAMQAETWYSSAQAVDAGLADRVANDTAADSKAAAPTDRRSQIIRARAHVTLRG
jgi:ATP-dependent protease ClpP protease subunit